MATLTQSIDIKSGDILVVGGNEYPIRSAARWSGTRNAIRQAQISCATKRSPGVVGGKRGEPETYLVGLKCTPLDPVDPETRQRMALDTPHEVLQTFVQGTYGFVHLTIEDLQR